MSATVKLAAKLPGEEEINGLDKWAEVFAAFEGPVCAVAWLDTAKVTVTKDGVEVPTVQVVRIEPVGQLADVPQEVIALVARLYEARVGRTALPFDEIAPVAHGDVEVDDRDGQLDYDEDVADHQGRGDVTENVIVIGDDQ